jgi:hypothetical protein
MSVISSRNWKTFPTKGGTSNMWVFTNKGFFSIVEDRNDSTKLLVRSRIKGDLERVFGDEIEEAGAWVTETPKADYRFRVFLPKEMVVAQIAREVSEIDYGNFKNSFAGNADLPSPLRAIMKYHMSDVWSAMWAAQKEAKEWEKHSESFPNLG